jgi:putative heme-binding domain-containing protein
MDFNLDGELFTFDSDNERCISLPWYEFTRLYHVIPGGHHGWLSPQRAQWWRLPPYFPDVVAPVTTLGRGSPTGVVCYRHVQFPERYRGGLFLCDWTFGKIHFVSLQRAGATYTARKEVFLESVGDNGFAPTAAAVHPLTGDLFVSIGGRGTRGAVYRIRYPKGLKAGNEKKAAQMCPPGARLDWRPDVHAERLAQVKSEDALERLRGLIAMRRHQEHFQSEELAAAFRANWDHADRYVRKAAGDLLLTHDGVRQALIRTPARTAREQATFALAYVSRFQAGPLNLANLILRDPKADPQTKLTAVRVMQEAFGGLVSPKVKGTVWEGYTVKGPLFATDRDRESLRQTFPSGNADLDRELSRTLAVLEDDTAATLARVADRLAAERDPVEELHYLIVLARLKAPRPPAVTERVAAVLLSLDRKLTERRLTRDSHWPLRVAELYAGLAQRDQALHAALLAHPEFGRPDHALFAASPGFDRKRAAALFLKRAQGDPDYPWNAAVVEIVGGLPEALPVLRRLWGRAGLEASLLPLLARDPQAGDRAKFVQGLASPQTATVRLCLDALRRLPPERDGNEIMALIQALGRLPQGAEAAVLKDALGVRLGQITGQTKLGADRAAWTAWFTTAYPKLAARLSNPDGVDVAGWEKRLAKIDWAAGDAGRGRAVFVKASCAACHSGSQALGPDLSGVAGRFSRADLFTAILQPSRDVSPRYQTTVIETADGKVYQGLVVYEAVDGLILQTGAATTVRVAGDQLAGRRVSPTSLMPAGLLDSLHDQEIVDLYAYLRGLGKASATGKSPR